MTQYFVKKKKYESREVWQTILLLKATFAL